jgi:phospholipid/cholesterol/gamma-HCH transport system substrate-binding protein
LLVLLPLGTANLQGAGVADRDTKHPGTYIDFNLNLNVPPACNTGFLPIQQMRTAQWLGARMCKLQNALEIAEAPP